MALADGRSIWVMIGSKPLPKEDLMKPSNSQSATKLVYAFDLTLLKGTGSKLLLSSISRGSKCRGESQRCAAGSIVSATSFRF